MIEQNYRAAAIAISQTYFKDNNLTYTTVELFAKADEIYNYIMSIQ